MMSGKIATSGLLKIKVLWNKGYDVIVPVHDVTNKISLYDSNYVSLVTLAFLWDKL